MLADMLAVEKGSITKDDLLGVMALYAVPDRPIPAHELASVWASEGLPPGMVPDGRRPEHTFMRACDNVKTGARGVPQTNRVVEITADCVNHDSTECVYQITRLVRDKVNQVINHKRAMTLRFDKAAIAQQMDPIQVVAQDSDMHEVEMKIRDYYAAHEDTVPGQKVRNAIRAAIISVGGTNLRGKSGGCYFVPIDGLDTIESMQRVLDALYAEDASLDTIPWLNTEATRKIVHKHHVASVRSDCEEMISRISERLSKESKPRTDMVTNMLAERRELGQRMREYRELLGGDVAAASVALELLDDQLENLMAKHAGAEIQTGVAA
jgi:hypothetical protein